MIRKLYGPDTMGHRGAKTFEIDITRVAVRMRTATRFCASTPPRLLKVVTYVKVKTSALIA